MDEFDDVGPATQSVLIAHPARRARATRPVMSECLNKTVSVLPASQLADDDDDDICAVCYSIICRPATLADCEHRFCRLCVFHCRIGSSGCPMCRAPLARAVQDALTPSDIAYDETSSAIIAARHSADYAEAIAKEAACETRIHKSLMRDVPLVIHPSSSFRLDPNKYRAAATIVRPGGGCFTKSTAKLTILFTDPAAQPALLHASKTKTCIGVIFRAGDSSVVRGFVAHNVRTTQSPREGGIRARLTSLQRFTVIRQRLRDVGQLVGDIELCA